MWGVPPEETVREMTDFYEIWLSDARQSGTIPGNRYEAFRKSQQNGLRLARESHGGYGHPFYWAGFVYFGDPGDIPSVSREFDAESSHNQ
jgi:CHAT domain-containing protein